MEICKCYRDEKNWLGGNGKCIGTKECEPCDCKGDRAKCDFYEEIRRKAECVAQPMTVGKLIDKLSHYPKDMEIKVTIEQKIRPLARVSVGIDVDTSKSSVWLVGEDK